MNSKNNEDIIQPFVSKVIIPSLDPEAVVLIGSTATKLSLGSDVDLVIMLNHKRMINFEEEIKKLNHLIKKFKLDQIRDISFIRDKENPRIEAKIIYDSNIFDLVITDSSVYYSTYSEDISKDNFELYVGNLFVHSKLLFQKRNYYSSLQKKYLPYYNDKLRTLRMAGLTKDINRQINQIKNNAQAGQIINALYYLNRTILSIIQLKFIQKRVYPLSYQKWINYQFKKILGEENFLNNLNEILKKTNLSKKDIIELANKLSNIAKKIK